MECFGKDWKKKTECNGCPMFNSCGSVTSVNRLSQIHAPQPTPQPTPQPAPQPAQQQKVAPQPTPHVLNAYEAFMSQLNAQSANTTSAPQTPNTGPFHNNSVPPNIFTGVSPPQPLPFTVPPPQMVQHPIEMTPMANYMPSYLTVPESWGEKESFMNFLGRTIIRTVFKSTGHSVSHVFDNTRLKR